MTEPTDKLTVPEEEWSEWLKPRRWLLFMQRVLTIESTIQELRSEVGALQAQARALESSIEELQAHIRILLPTISGVVDDKVRIAVLERVPELIEKELRRRGEPRE